MTCNTHMTCVQLGTYILHTRLQPLAHTYYILASNHLHIHTCKLNPFFSPHTSHATRTSHSLTPVFRSCGNRLGIRASCQRLLRHGHRPPLVQHVRRRSLQARQVCACSQTCSISRQACARSICACVCVRAARCVCVCVCVRACVRVCVHVCSMFGVHLLKHYSCVVCVSLLEPRDLHARTHACPHARTHERTHARTRSRTHVNSPDKFGRFSQSTFTMFQVAVP